MSYVNSAPGGIPLVNQKLILKKMAFQRLVSHPPLRNTDRPVCPACLVKNHTMMVQTSRSVDPVDGMYTEGVIARYLDGRGRPGVVDTNYTPGEKAIRVGGCERYVPPGDKVSKI
jgi:hypothetical protein